MSDQKEGTSDVYVNLEQLLFQLTHASVALERLSKSELSKFLVKNVTAVTKVIHADAVLEMQYYRSEDEAKKSIEAYCKTCRKKAMIQKLHRNCNTCKRRLFFHCMRCNAKKLSYNQLYSHLRDQLILYCSICGFWTAKALELQKHTKSVHEKNLVFQCLRCDKSIKNFGGFHSHVKFCGKVSDISCSICGRKYKMQTALDHHKIKKHSKMLYYDKRLIAPGAI